MSIYTHYDMHCCDPTETCAQFSLGVFLDEARICHLIIIIYINSLTSVCHVMTY